jgi:plastocyanin
MTILQAITEAARRVSGRHALTLLTMCAAAGLVSVPRAAPATGRTEGIATGSATTGTTEGIAATASATNGRIEGIAATGSATNGTTEGIVATGSTTNGTTEGLAATGSAASGRIDAAATGRIEGIVHLGVTARASLASGAYAPRRVTRASTASGGVPDVVVFVRNAPATADLTVTRARMVQRDEAFEPRVLAITRGSTVEFPNADPFFHNVFSLSSGSSFDLGRYKRGDSRGRGLARPGLVKVYCHVHSQMSASILVLDNTYFTMPKADGRFDLPDVPPGTYRLSAWQERLGERQVAIQVQAGQTTRVEVNLPLGPS